MYTTGELRDAASAMVTAQEKNMEIGEGVGGLGLHHPDLLEDWGRWLDMSENLHADTVLSLLDEIDRQRKINRRLNRYIDELEEMEESK